MLLFKPTGSYSVGFFVEMKLPNQIVCEIMDKETLKRCGRPAKLFIFEQDCELMLCKRHYQIWKERGRLELKDEENKEE